MKAQVKIISALLLVLVALSLTSAMLTWGLPILERIHHETLAERVAHAFDQMYADSLPRRIRYIAGYGGEAIFKLGMDGVWKLKPYQEGNFLQFTFGSKFNATPLGQWIPLPDERGVVETCPPSPGKVGINSPAVVCVRSDETIEIFNITYRIWFRSLCEELIEPWSYRKPITIIEQSGSNLLDYQVLVTLDTATLIADGKMQADCDDIRFTNTDGMTLLPYWLEGACNTANTKVWVKIPEIKANEVKTIYLYYGNPEATSGSDAVSTFVRVIDEAQPVVGSWHLDEGSGTIAYDTSGNANDGIIYGASWGDGKFGKALSFDGSENNVTVQHSSSLDISDQITLEAWVNVTGPSAIAAVPWLYEWQYRKPIIISNSLDTALTDYQVLITLDTSTLIFEGKMQSNCNDMRFTSSDGTTLLNYWLESGCNTPSTKIWVKVPSIPASSSETIYIYYGNPSAISESNKDATFVYWTGDYSEYCYITSKGATCSVTFTGSDLGYAGHRFVDVKIDLFIRGDLNYGGVKAEDGTCTDSYEWVVILRNNICVGTYSTGYQDCTWRRPSNWPKWFYSVDSEAINLVMTANFGPRVSFNPGGCYGYGDADFHILETWLRKYATTEPSVTIGTEEIAPMLGVGEVVDKSMAYGLAANQTHASGRINNNIISAPLASGWQHLALTYDGNEIKLYINAEPAITQSLTEVIATNINPLLIGQYFNGTIDEIRIYSRALTSEEISDLYDNYGYTTLNDPGKVFVRKYALPEPSVSVGIEERAEETFDGCAANVKTYEVRLIQPQKSTSVARDIKIGLSRRYTKENLIIAEVDIFLA